MLFRDIMRIEDVGTSGPDRGAEATRSGCLRQQLVADVKLLRHRC